MATISFGEEEVATTTPMTARLGCLPFVPTTSPESSVKCASRERGDLVQTYDLQFPHLNQKIKNFIVPMRNKEKESKVPINAN